MTTTFVGALRHNDDHGALPLRRADERRCFLADAEQFLAPTLREGDVVAMTICQPTESPASGRRSSKPAQRCVIRQPTPSAVRQAALGVAPGQLAPDLNPIEQTYAKLKALAKGRGTHLRSAHQSHRSKRSPSSNRKNAPTTSRIQAIATTAPIVAPGAASGSASSRKWRPPARFRTSFRSTRARRTVRRPAQKGGVRRGDRPLARRKNEQNP
jgi:hypothetical protein